MTSSFRLKQGRKAVPEGPPQNRQRDSEAGPHWQLVTSRRCDPWWNMALDESILNNSIQLNTQPQLRVYGWDRPCLSLGAHLDVDQDVRDRCDQEGVCLVRRPTGGGAVLHSDDVTYCVVAPILPGGVLESYRWVATGLISGLNRLGIEARVVEHRGRADALACFSKSTGADLEAGGRKICGSAQVRRDGWFLQHGSIPLSDNRSRTHQLLGTQSMKDDSTFLGHFGTKTWSDVAEAVLKGFRDVWGSEVESRFPSPDELQEASALAASC